MEKVSVLEEELAKLQEHIARLKAAVEDKPDYGMGEGDPRITQWEMNKVLLEQSYERQASLEQALSRYRNGKYGLCMHCGAEIHPDRLVILPGTKSCIECARKGLDR